MSLSKGKDVYCEKPLTHNIQEAIDVIRSVDKHKCVLQTGSMQRSMKEFRIACELVRNGYIGKIDHVECSFGGPPIPCAIFRKRVWNLDWTGTCGLVLHRCAHIIRYLAPGVHNIYPLGVPTGNMVPRYW
jgi:predicted dehydrogenase